MVSVVDLSRRGERFAAPFAIAAERIARSGHFLLGPELDSFESSFATVAGTTHVVGVSSGASALQIALIAAGVKPGDDVIVPGFTAVPTASAVMAVGARPIVADVDPGTACVTAATIEAARTDRTTAAIVVHLYGYPATVPDTDLIVIEDAAQATGALSAMPRISAATAYSFYPTKNLGGIGDGGAVATDDEAIAESCRRLRVHGMTAQYVHEAVSQNFRMSEVEAVWLGIALPSLAADNRRRREIVEHYRRAAPQLCWAADHADHVYHLAVFRSNERERDRAQLAGRGVSTAIHYPLAILQQPAYRDLPHVACPESEAWAASCISVPCFPEMTDDEIATVGDALANLTG